jgi:triosephosphate isomerase
LLKQILGIITVNAAAVYYSQDLFKQEDVDGGLVGGASLKAEEFISICKSVDR